MKEDMEKSAVMVVDDIPENLQLLKALLQDQGYYVLAFSSGRAALNALDRVLPDVILLDILMPDMDGFEVCRRIRGDNRFRVIPVIFISALSDQESKAKAFEKGGVDYVMRPLHEKEVLARVGAYTKIAELQRRLQTCSDNMDSQVMRRTRELLRINKQLQSKIQEYKQAVAALHQTYEALNLAVEEGLGE
ncbi:MAG: response regulator [Desulfotignum sp.]|nr:response regulator [Desulfotignum sp.]MCF8137530.1 response regulator [Desulfotignum sp.]